MRALVVVTGVDEFVLAMIFDKLTVDGRSLALLARECNSYFQGELIRARPPIPYSKYAEWQRATVSPSILEAQTAYWTRELAGADGYSLSPVSTSAERTTQLVVGVKLASRRSRLRDCFKPRGRRAYHHLLSLQLCWRSFCLSAVVTSLSQRSSQVVIEASGALSAASPIR